MFYLDTNKLSFCIDDTLEQKRTAQKLSDKIHSIKRLTYSKYNVDRNLLLKFQRLTKESENLVNYYSKLSVALDSTKTDAVKMINQTNQMMENYLDISKNLMNNNISIDIDDK